MKGKFLSSPLHVAEPRRAAVFSDPLRRRLVLSLGQRERSMTELARLTGVELKRVHYHVKTLLALGLVVVAREQPRSGRAVKLYRAVAPAFFVPDAAAATMPSDALSAELQAALRRQRERSPGGTFYETDAAKSQPIMRRVTIDGARATSDLEQWRVLRLSQVQAQQLGHDLAACLRRYDSSSSGRDYLVYVAIAARLQR